MIINCATLKYLTVYLETDYILPAFYSWSAINNAKKNERKKTQHEALCFRKWLGCHKRNLVFNEKLIPPQN